MPAVSFGAARFLAGLGIGGVMPNVIAQMTEYAPQRVRSTMVALMFSGYSIGSMLAALLGKGLFETYGWQSVFIAAGLPVLLIPLILKSMPESVAFLIRRCRSDELKRLTGRIAEVGQRHHDADGAAASIPTSGPCSSARCSRWLRGCK